MTQPLEQILLEASKLPELQQNKHKKSLRGCLKHYAKPDLMKQEQDAWQAAMCDKHRS